MRMQFIATFAVSVLSAGCSSNSDVASDAPAQSAHRKAYVGLFGDGSVAVLDTVTNQVTKKIPVTAPDGLVITPDGKKAYVSSTDSASVKVIITADDSLAASIDVGAKPAGLSITPDGASVLVSVGGADEAVIIDTGTDTVVRRISVAAAHASCVTADGHFAFVASQATGAPAIVRVDISGDAAPRSFPVDRSPRMLSCTPGKIYFTAVGLDAVEVLDPTTGTTGPAIMSGGSPHDVRATRDGRFELVVSQTAGDLEFIDAETATVTATVPTGKLAHWITLFDEGNGAYVTNEGDNNVVSVDFATRQVRDTIPIGSAPRKMALQP